MKKFIKSLILLAACAPFVAKSNPFDNIPGYGQYQEIKGYVIDCPTELGYYHYWFAVGTGTSVAISKVGYPNGVQSPFRVIDGEKISGGYDIVVQKRSGETYRIRWVGNKGVFMTETGSMECSAKSTTFIL